MPFGPSDRGPRHPANFGSPRPSTWIYTITGTTVDAAGAVVPNCLVKLFESGTDREVAQTTSDGSGAFTFHPPTNSGFFYMTAFSSDGTLVGSTRQNIVAV